MLGLLYSRFTSWLPSSSFADAKEWPSSTAPNCFPWHQRTIDEFLCSGPKRFGLLLSALQQRCPGAAAGNGILSREFAASVLQSRRACCACRGFQRAPHVSHAAYTQRSSVISRKRRNFRQLNEHETKKKSKERIQIVSAPVYECFGLAVSHFNVCRLPAYHLQWTMPEALNCICLAAVVVVFESTEKNELFTFIF